MQATCSIYPFSALLALLDDTELEQAASLWGVEVLPGLQDRDDLAGQIMQALEDPVRRKSVAGKPVPGCPGRLAAHDGVPARVRNARLVVRCCGAFRRGNRYRPTPPQCDWPARRATPRLAQLRNT